MNWKQVLWQIEQYAGICYCALLVVKITLRTLVDVATHYLQLANLLRIRS